MEAPTVMSGGGGEHRLEPAYRAEVLARQPPMPATGSGVVSAESSRQPLAGVVVECTVHAGGQLPLSEVCRVGLALVEKLRKLMSEGRPWGLVPRLAPAPVGDGRVTVAVEANPELCSLSLEVM